MTARHTPGPWVALDIGEIVTENLEICIATINGADTSTVAEDEANARLIAAAPLLLKALQEAVAQYGKPGGPWNVPSDPGGWISRAKDALAAAGLEGAEA